MIRFNKPVWRETTFGELIEFHDHKRIPLSSKERASRQGDVPYYGASGVIDHIDGYIFDGPYLLISEDGENLNSRKTPIAFRANGKFWVNNHAHIVRGRPHVADDRFLEYLIAVTDISGIVTGAAQPKLSQANLRILKVCVPDHHTQTAIVEILSAYDDLIENNTRRVTILEEMAKMIYREWFVNFLFPGHQKVKMVESEMGTVPKGWPVQKVAEAVDIDPTTKVSKEGMKPFVSMGSLSHTSMLITEIEKREGNSGSKFRNGDTLFARITPCLENGKTGFVQFLPDSEAVGFGSTEFIVLRPRTVNPEYVYLMARSEEFRDNAIKSMSGATGRQRVQEQCFDRFLIAHPPSDLLQAFQSAVTPMFRLIYALSLKNGNLRPTRDLLLPKLISGEVGVKEVEAEAVAQGV